MDMIRKVLITGCSGFLGQKLLEVRTGESFLESPGCHRQNDIQNNIQNNIQNKIHGITEIMDYESPDITVHHVDIRDREKVFSIVETVKPDVTFHLAAIANVGYSWKNQISTYEINFIGSSNLLEALAKFE